MSAQPQYDVFISYSHADRPWVYGYLLPALGLPPERFITPQNFLPGAPVVAEFERAITSSRYTVLVLSPAYLADEWSTFSEQLISYTSVVEQRDRLIPLLLQPSALPLRLDFRVRLDCTNEANWQEETARLRSLLAQPEPAPERIPCPYPGMVPFSIEDARCFYGREKEIDELLRHLRHQNYLFVIGPSGSGKSSLISAGLIAALDERQPGQWLVKSMRPGDKPQQTLIDLLGGSPTSDSQSVEGYTALVNTALAKNSSSQRLLLIIDQFEELFTQTPKPDQLAFIATIKLLQQVKNCVLILAIRADFYPDLMNSDLWPVALGQRVEIAPLRGVALREAIAKPATGLGVYLEVGLLERLLADAADEPGVLPLVQETMVLLWEKMAHRLLPLSAYEQLGSEGRSGLAVAMASKADATLAQLSPNQQVIARRIFLRLVQFGEGRLNTRRQQSATALQSSSDDPLLFEQTLRHLVDNRLLTLTGEEEAGSRIVDMAHEMLIISWPELQHEVEEYQKAELTRRRLQARANEWIELNRRGGLLDQTELLLAKNWLSTAYARELGIDSNLKDFIIASQARIQVNKRTQWLRPLVAVIVVVVFTLGSLAIYRILLRQHSIRLSPLTVIPGGLATIGTDDPAIQTDSKPAWQVTLSSFEMDTHEVTNEQYCLCRRAGACQSNPSYNNGDVCDAELAKYPVTNVTLLQASEFCQWIGRRLPTEIEWEWAARGSKNRLYPTGNDPPIPGQVNLFDRQFASKGTWPVSASSSDHTPNGILDMTSNVREWTPSLWLRYDDPQYPTAYWPNQVDEAEGFVITRGGSWRTGVASAQCVVRYRVQPGEPLDDVGFRCLKGLPLPDFVQEVFR